MKANKLTILIDEMENVLKNMNRLETVMRNESCPLACFINSKDNLKKSINILKQKRNSQVKEYLKK